MSGPAWIYRGKTYGSPHEVIEGLEAESERRRELVEWERKERKGAQEGVAALVKERDAALLQKDELKSELKKAHDGHGYRNGLGPCICKWCAEKPKGDA